MVDAQVVRKIYFGKGGYVVYFPQNTPPSNWMGIDSGYPYTSDFQHASIFPNAVAAIEYIERVRPNMPGVYEIIPLAAMSILLPNTSDTDALMAKIQATLDRKAELEAALAIVNKTLEETKI